MFVKYSNASQEVSQGTVLRMRWVERYKNEGNVNIHYRKPVAYKVKKEYVKLLVDEINKNKTI
jgi:hypothetical protein